MTFRIDSHPFLGSSFSFESRWGNPNPPSYTVTTFQEPADPSAYAYMPESELRALDQQSRQWDRIGERARFELRRRDRQRKRGEYETRT